jgi:uncharacterized membrane protein YedE/YeeE
MIITNFTPLPALIGGLLIGLASALLMLGFGRIFGISGIIAGIIKPQKGDTFWKVIAVVGLLVGAFTANYFMDSPQKIQTVSLPYLIVGGLFTGFGTRLGSGCTSGHGVCGISRLSKRSIVATMTFILSGIVTVYLVNR